MEYTSAWNVKIAFCLALRKLINNFTVGCINISCKTIQTFWCQMKGVALDFVALGLMLTGTLGMHSIE